MHRPSGPFEGDTKFVGITNHIPVSTSVWRQTSAECVKASQSDRKKKRAAQGRDAHGVALTEVAGCDAVNLRAPSRCEAAFHVPGSLTESSLLAFVMRLEKIVRSLMQE